MAIVVVPMNNWRTDRTKNRADSVTIPSKAHVNISKERSNGHNDARTAKNGGAVIATAKQRSTRCDVSKF